MNCFWGRGLKGKVAFDETSMALLLERQRQGVEIVVVGFQPGREVGQWGRQFSLKHQVGHDGLQPGGAALVGAGDDDVVIAERHSIPAKAVEVMVVNAAGSLRICAPRADGHQSGLMQ